MSPLVKGLLASALTLPLVAFVAGVLASPDPVDPDRSRPVIIGRINDDKPAEDRTPEPSREKERKDAKPQRPAGAADEPDDEPDDDPGDDVTDDRPYTVVTPPPRDLDDDDDGGDDGDDDDTDGSRDSGGSGDD